MRFVFLLSKEHETLPKAEVEACLNALSVRFNEVLHEHSLLVVDLTASPSFNSPPFSSSPASAVSEEKSLSELSESETAWIGAFRTAKSLASRLGMTHHILIALGDCDLAVVDETDAKKTAVSLSELVDEKVIERVFAAKSSVEIIDTPSFAVRVTRLYSIHDKHHDKHHDDHHDNQRGGARDADAGKSTWNARWGIWKENLEREMGAVFKRKCGWLRVNLKNPALTFLILLTKTRVFLCVLAASVDKKQFQSRRPHLRPFCHPVTIAPKLARVLVNLSSVRHGEVLLDPFCGTGGILIEAAQIGVRAVGVDIRDEMVRGSMQNLKSCGLNAELIVGDALKMPFKDESVDAITADLPYGRSSFVSISDGVRRLWTSAMEEVARVLKPRRRAVLVSNAPLPDASSLEVLEEHRYRVHKSLCRFITVLMKR